MTLRLARGGNTAERIRAEVAAYVEANAPVGRDTIVRDVTGRSESILASLGELVAERRLWLTPSGYAPAGFVYVEPWRRLEDRCCRLGDAELEADCPGRLGPTPRPGCWSDAWGAAGRPMPVPEWDRAGRPGRAAWAAAGGRFSFDAIDAHYWPDCTCQHANGGRRCRRQRCYDCRPQPDGWRFEAPVRER